MQITRNNLWHRGRQGRMLCNQRRRRRRRAQSCGRRRRRRILREGYLAMLHRQRVYGHAKCWRVLMRVGMVGRERLQFRGRVPRRVLTAHPTHIHIRKYTLHSSHTQHVHGITQGTPYNIRIERGLLYYAHDLFTVLRE